MGRVVGATLALALLWPATALWADGLPQPDVRDPGAPVPSAPVAAQVDPAAPLGARRTGVVQPLVEAPAATPAVAAPRREEIREVALTRDQVRRGSRSGLCAPVPCRSLCGFVEDYVPFMPTPETRSAWTSLTTVPTPFALTAGEADTPCCGMFRASVQRISDERRLQDLAGNTYRSDGEVRTISLEVVSPAFQIPIGRGLRAHASVSAHISTRNFALFDRLRNFVEEYLLDADQAVLDAHDIGGSELEIERTNGTIDKVLDSRALTRIRGALKIHLPRTRIFGRPLQTALSVGLTSPGFGNFKASTNDEPLVDLTLAYALPISRCFRLQGATFISNYDDVDRYNALGIDQADVVVGSTLTLEWWITRHFAASLGVSYNSSVWDGTGLPMDLDSYYFQIGLMGRLSKSADVYLVWAENPEPRITETRGADFDDSQKDADFTFLLGTRIRF